MGIVFGKATDVGENKVFSFFLSSVNLYFLLTFIRKFFHLCHLKRKYDFLAYILLIPYIFLISDKFFVSRLILYDILRTCFKKKSVSNLAIKSLSYVIFWIFNPHIFLYSSCYLSLLCSFSYSLFGVYIKDSIFKKLSFAFCLNLLVELLLKKDDYKFVFVHLENDLYSL